MRPIRNIFLIAACILTTGGSASAQSFTWTSTGLDAPSSIADFAIASNGSIFVATWNHRVLRSTDNGVTWKSASSGLPTLPILAISAAPNGYLYASSEGLGLFRSINNGTAWSSLGSATGSAPEVILFDASGALIVGGEKGVYRSTDNGKTWKTVGSGLPETFVRSLTIGSDGTILAGLISGAKYRLPSNGTQWEAISAEFAEAVEAPTGDFIATKGEWNEAGTLTRSTDRGATWTTVSVPGTIQLGQVLVRDSSGALLNAPIDGGLLRSTDQGATWERYGSGLDTTRLFQVKVAPSGAVYVVVDRTLYTDRPVQAGVGHTMREESAAIIRIAPNHVTGSGSIAFTLSRQGTTDVAVYDCSGRRVTTLFTGYLERGIEHRLPLERGTLAGGRYYVRVQQETGAATVPFSIVR